MFLYMGLVVMAALSNIFLCHNKNSNNHVTRWLQPCAVKYSVVSSVNIVLVAR